jgi:hypothetical protein
LCRQPVSVGEGIWLEIAGHDLEQRQCQFGQVTKVAARGECLSQRELGRWPHLRIVSK